MIKRMRISTFLFGALALGAMTAQAQSTIVEIDPTPGMAFEIVNYVNGITFICNPADVNIEDATVTFTTEEGEQTEPLTWEARYGWTGDVNLIQIGMVDTVAGSATEGENGFSWYYQLALKGTDVIVTLKNVTYDGEPVVAGDYQNDYVTVDENGTITLIYPKPAEDFEPISDVWPTAIYSNMPEGSVGTITFNEELQPDIANTTMAMGHQVYGSISGGDDPAPFFTLPTSVEGNILTVDFSGIDFAAEATSSLNNYNEVTIMVFGVYSVSGQSYPEGATPYTVYLKWDESTSRVSTVVKENTEREIYNLQGVKINGKDVENLPSGIYIINGKKVVK